MWWVIHRCRGFDPLFSLWQDRARSFGGTFSHPRTAKLSFGVQKLPIFTKMDLFGPKFNFFLDLFGSNFQRPAAHPHQFSGRVPPPPPPPGEFPHHVTVSSSFSTRFLYGFPYRFQRAWTVLWSTRCPLDVVRIGAWNSLSTKSQFWRALEILAIR